jgi:hypothetical protein
MVPAIPAGTVTCTGRVRCVTLVPSPRLPPVLSPQVYTQPSEVSAIEVAPPAAMAMTVFPVIAPMSTGTGSVAPVIPPVPSWPEALAPQAKSWPLAASASTWLRPQRSRPHRPAQWFRPRHPRRAHLSRKRGMCSALPSPSWPLALAPQAKSFPSRRHRVAAGAVGILPRWKRPSCWRKGAGPAHQNRRVGEVLVLPTPIWPLPPAPQANTLPSEVSASELSPIPRYGDKHLARVAALVGTKEGCEVEV